VVSAASVAYRPIGLLGGMLAGAVAVAAFKAVWRKASHEDHLPTAMDGDLPLVEVLVAATVQGAIFALVKTIVDRGGARAFQKATGLWPGAKSS
jgi:hypothetical protein